MELAIRSVEGGNMGKLSWDLQSELTPQLRAGEIEGCEQAIAATLRSFPDSPFHIILDLSITTEPAGVALEFDNFFRQQPFKIQAAYTETNGFDINPDLWFFSPFAYELYGGHD